MSNVKNKIAFLKKTSSKPLADITEFCVSFLHFYVCTSSYIYGIDETDIIGIFSSSLFIIMKIIFKKCIKRWDVGGGGRRLLRFFTFSPLEEITYRRFKLCSFMGHVQKCDLSKVPVLIVFTFEGLTIDNNNIEFATYIFVYFKFLFQMMCILV